jgi:hypothetical protein
VGDGVPAALLLRPRRARRDTLLQRRSGDADNPRLQRKDVRLACVYMFTHFTDRDGKFQLCAPRSLRSIHSRERRNSC